MKVILQSPLPSCKLSGGQKPVASLQCVARSQWVLQDGSGDGIQAEIYLKMRNSSIQPQFIIFLIMKIIFTEHFHENDFIEKKERVRKIHVRRKNVDFAAQRESPDDNVSQEQGSNISRLQFFISCTLKYSEHALKGYNF